MAETNLDELKRRLDSELSSSPILPLPADYYSRLSVYCQKLKRSSGSGTSDATVRLIARQTSLIASMVSQLLELRASKAAKQNAIGTLLPEERYVSSAERKFEKRFKTFVDAVSAGQPSFIEFAHKKESERVITVRFAKKVGELIGLDMKRYGPFEVDDIAAIPAANADILIAGGDAIEVHTREET